MAQIQQRLLALTVLLLPAFAAQKFYPDDPLPRDPKPLPALHVTKHGINEYFDFFQQTFFEPDKQQKKRHTPPPSQAVNTLGEVPDSAWFTNRLGSRPMTVDELVRGPGTDHAPATDKPWTVVSGKNEGVTPGLVIRDSAGRRYFLKFDPKPWPEMATAADVLGCKFFHALGYNVPENYIVNFDRKQLQLNDKSKYRDPLGHQREMRERDVEDVLEKVHRDTDGRYRGMASLTIPGDIVGPFRYSGTRTDDPNDIVPHENRRDLRGLYVFSAWLNHTDSKSINSLDSIVKDEGTPYVRHFLIDFGAILGSDSFEPKSPRAGHVYLFDFKPAASQFVSFGLYTPGWMRAGYPHITGVGHLDYETFDPEDWRNNYPNPAFDLRTPGDNFWAAKKLMAFSNDAIRAIVAAGHFSDPRAVDWISKCLIERRNRIGRAFFNDVLPLDDFSVREGSLRYTDLAVQYGFRGAQQSTVQWSEFDNRSGAKTPIAGAATFAVPRARTEYLAAEIAAADSRKTVTVYLRGDTIVGIDRTW